MEKPESVTVMSQNGHGVMQIGSAWQAKEDARSNDEFDHRTAEQTNLNHPEPQSKKFKGRQIQMMAIGLTSYIEADYRCRCGFWSSFPFRRWIGKWGGCFLSCGLPPYGNSIILCFSMFLVYKY